MTKSNNTEEFLKQKRKKKLFVFRAKDKAKLIEALNAQCAVVLDGDTTRYVIKKRNGGMRFLDEKSAKGWFKNYRYINKDDKEKDGFDIWLKDEDAQRYDDIIFNPDLTDAAKYPSELNLFSGWAYKPKPGPGAYSLLNSHILKNLCGENQELYDYTMDWASQMFCEPQMKPGVALVFRGLPGVGKSILAVILRRMVGMIHSRTLHQKEQIVGKFNSHYRNTILVIVEEAFFAGDPTARTVLNTLITDRYIATEGKSKNLEDGPTFVRFIIIANHDWVAPVVVGDRRYVIYDVSDAHKEDKKHFDAILQQMENGGFEALLYDLIERGKKFMDLPPPPMTEAKREQLLHGLSPEVEWLLDAVEQGRFPFRDTGRVDLWEEVPGSIHSEPQVIKRMQIDWPEAGGEVERDAITASYRDIVPGHKGRKAASITVGKILKKWIPNIEDGRPTIEGKRPYTYKLPALSVARAALEKTLQFKFSEPPVEAANDAAPTALQDGAAA